MEYQKFLLQLEWSTQYIDTVMNINIFTILFWANNNIWIYVDNKYFKEQSVDNKVNTGWKYQQKLWSWQCIKYKV